MKTQVNKNQIKIPGGLINQALIKNSSADYDFGWADQSGSGSIVGGLGNKIGINSVSANTYTISIPGGTLGVDNAVRFTLLIDTSGWSLPSSGASSGVDVIASYGGQTFTFNYTKSGGSTITKAFTVDGYIIANGATNSQKGISTSAVTKDVTGGSAGTESITPGYNTSMTVDSTVDQDLIITIAGTGAHSGSVSFESIIVESIGGNGGNILPITTVYNPSATLGSATTQFDITNPSGDTFRYTWNSTGTDPVINSTTFPIGLIIQIFGTSFVYGSGGKNNNGQFTVTGSGSNYFEVTNTIGLAETNKALGAGFLIIPQVWTKPVNLKYINVEVQGAGGAGGGCYSDLSASGAGGAYSKKNIDASVLGSTEYITVGKGASGLGGGLSNIGFWNYHGGGSYFSSLSCGGGKTSPNGNVTDTIGGTATGGDVNLDGSNGYRPIRTGSSPTINMSGVAGSSSIFPNYAKQDASGTSNAVDGNNATNYGGGGTGAIGAGPGSYNASGGSGRDGVIIITEYF